MEVGQQAILPGKCERKKKKSIPRFGRSGVVDSVVAPKRCVHVLIPGNCECDLIKKKVSAVIMSG